MQTWTTCSLSGEQIETPVISKVSGHIFEKRLIEKHIEATGTCPITGRPLSQEDLIPVKVSPIQKPRPVAATSVPSLIQLLQNEWDSLLLEQFQLKQHLEKVRHELTHALYQHDAACRVIARVIKERDQARLELAQLQEKIQSNKMQTETNIESDRLPETVQRDIEEMALKLNNMRKQRRKQSDYLLKYPTKESLTNFETKKQFSIGKGVCLDIQKDLTLVGCVDGSVILQDSKEQQKVLNDHKQKVTSVNFIYIDENVRFVSTSEDGSMFGYVLEEEQLRKYYSYKGDSAIMGFALHPIRYMGVHVEQNGVFGMHDVYEGRQLAKFKNYEGSSQFSSVAIHPDGHFMGLGQKDGIIKIWRFNTHEQIVQLEGQKGEVKQLNFSENGIQLGSRGDNEVNIWSLKTSEIVQKLFEGKQIGVIQFDESGQYLAISENGNINLLETKGWQTFQKLDVHKDVINGIKFGQFSKSLVSCSLDQNVNVTS